MARTPATHTGKTLAALRDRGYAVAIVERWLAEAKKRIDAYGFIDILAIKENEILAVQSTGNAAPRGNPTQERIRKITGNRHAYLWLLAGGRIEIYVWRRLKVRRGGVAYRWEPVLTEITLADFPPEIARGAP